MERRTLSAGDSSLVSYRPLIEALGIEPRQLASAEQFAAWLAACNDWLSRHGRPERLVPGSKGRKPSALEYERRIVEQARIETRDNLHDSMNALVWLQYPATKNALSRLHLSQSSGRAEATGRGPRRDAATLFDEHGLVVLAREPDALSWLQAKHWAQAFLTNRELFLRQTRLVVFGHALLERLAAPYKGVTGHAMLVPWSAERWPSEAELDELLAARVAALVSPRDLLACPVMGWPGYAPNQDEAYYADREVFRPASKRQASEPR